MFSPVIVEQELPKNKNNGDNPIKLSESKSSLSDQKRNFVVSGTVALLE